MSITARVVKHDQYNGDGVTLEETLSHWAFSKPDKINSVVTFLYGSEEKKFPLQFFTEGQKSGYDFIEVDTTEYTWDVMDRLRRSSTVVSSPETTGKPGFGGKVIEVTFKDNWLKYQRTVVSPSGVQGRIMERPVKSSFGVGYKYKIRLWNSASFLPLSDLTSGARWSHLGAAAVTRALSVGTDGNVQAPGKLKNQVTTIRHSYRIAGNMASKMVEFKITDGNASMSKYLPMEEYQQDIDWKQMCEEEYWYSEYNREVDGTINMRDPLNDLVIGRGAGILNMIPNEDTYGLVLPYAKLMNVIGTVMYGATDTKNMEILLYTGQGGARVFHDTLFREGTNNGFTDVTGEKNITGEGYNLTYGAYFNKYRHIDGHIITLAVLPIFDHGGRAENAPKHPDTGWPVTSYDMIFVDQSSYQGSKNIQMISEKGRQMVKRYEMGMATPPQSIKYDSNMPMSTEKDEMTIHYLASKNCNMRRNTHCFKLKCVIS